MPTGRGRPRRAATRWPPGPGRRWPGRPGPGAARSPGPSAELARAEAVGQHRRHDRRHDEGQGADDHVEHPPTEQAGRRWCRRRLPRRSVGHSRDCDPHYGAPSRRFAPCCRWGPTNSCPTRSYGACDPTRLLVDPGRAVRTPRRPASPEGNTRGTAHHGARPGAERRGERGPGRAVDAAGTPRRRGRAGARRRELGPHAADPRRHRGPPPRGGAEQPAARGGGRPQPPAGARADTARRSDGRRRRHPPLAVPGPAAANPDPGQTWSSRPSWASARLGWGVCDPTRRCPSPRTRSPCTCCWRTRSHTPRCWPGRRCSPPPGATALRRPRTTSCGCACASRVGALHAARRPDDPLPFHAQQVTASAGYRNRAFAEPDFATSYAALSTRVLGTGARLVRGSARRRRTDGRRARPVAGLRRRDEGRGGPAPPAAARPRAPQGRGGDHGRRS